jgi:ABC-2 type transport system permease protein
MTQVLALAKKELRGYFRSPVALIFLGTFLLVTLFVVFWVDTFFRRNIADARPLFHWLPILLVFLVGALTMRLWSEEQRTGTLEVLLTLPVKIHRLVLGKFLAGLALVALALLLTLGIPVTVSMIGDLDWGPVFGGYLGAVLLASAYLAVGLCFSSSTDNPIVALISTWLACGALYLVGSDAVVSFAGNRMAEILEALGTGSRFESIQRGVIDLRDLLYYASLTVGFLLLNVALLLAKRWSAGASTRKKRTATRLTVVLVCVNLVVLNLTLGGVRWARVDLTARREYSISPATRKLLQGLDAPLLIRGYFSAKTHPLLAPLVPRIRDLAQEYAAVGGKRIRVEFVDPQKDKTTEKEASDDYGVKSVPFQFEDRHEASVVNSYFSILVKYGDKYELLNFQDLIEVKVTGMKDIEVKLRNLEYDLTRTIKKAVYGFQPLEEVFARAPGKVTLTAYVTPKTLPKALHEIPSRLDKVVKEVEKRAGGRLVFETVDPSGPDKEGLRRGLYEKYGFKPLATSFFSDESFYLHLLLSVGDRNERLYPAPEMSEADLRTEITAALKRLVPGFLKTVGLVVPPPETPPQPNPMMRRPRDTSRRFDMLREKLAETYTVKEVDLKDGRVPGEVDVLFLLGPQGLDEKQRFAVDQYLMRGGAVVLCSGAFTLDASSPVGLTVKPVKSGLEEMLAGWGVKVLPKMVLDPQNEPFAVPRGSEILLVPYAPFVDVRRDGMAEDSAIVSALPSVTLEWVSPLELSPPAGVKATALLKSSRKSWMRESTEVQPDLDKYGDLGFPVEGETKPYILAAILTGTFGSAFADKPSPLFKDEGKKGEEKKAAKEAKPSERAGQTIKASPSSARLAVVGSSDFLNDVVLMNSRQMSERYTSSLQLAQNVADWSVADVDLLSIRSRGTYARTLKPMDEATRSTWEGINYGLVLLGLGLVVGVSFVRRRSIRPMKLVEAKKLAEASHD